MPLDGLGGRALAIVNQKGGVGKTTTAVNLAAGLALEGRATLLIDLDPQANASSAFGVVAADRHIYDVLIGRHPLSQVARATEIDTLHLVPSGTDLVGIEIELANSENRERLLEAALAEAREHYEFTIIDCPPSLSILTLNALTASDSLLIPLQCEYYALEGLARLLETLERVRDRFNAELAIEGLLLTMVDSRNNLSRQVEAEVRSHFGDRVYQTRIPRNVRLSEAPSHGKPVALYDNASAGARAYAALTREILSRSVLRDPPLRPPQLESQRQAKSEATAGEASPAASQPEGADHGRYA
ncbi:MAG: AAA family ATPase [Myxococcota bacterium]|jgi:chromosome partitioning protein